VWFRDLPTGLFNDIPKETIYKVTSLHVCCCRCCSRLTSRCNTNALSIAHLHALTRSCVYLPLALPLVLAQVATEPYDAAVITATYQAFPEPNKSLILWLLDMMADIVQNEPANKMGAKNMAIVLSPNL